MEIIYKVWESFSDGRHFITLFDNCQDALDCFDRAAEYFESLDYASVTPMYSLNGRFNEADVIASFQRPFAKNPPHVWKKELNKINKQ